jgi:hypothetical protein
MKSCPAGALERRTSAWQVADFLLQKEQAMIRMSGLHAESRDTQGGGMARMYKQAADMGRCTMPMCRCLRKSFRIK